jgi:trimethylamine--corrinoid protein Co-methyltransferase
VMQTEYIYPEFGDRLSPNEWIEQDKPVILEKAIRKKKEILASYHPAHISDEIDLKVREQFPIFLPREAYGRTG